MQTTRVAFQRKLDNFLSIPYLRCKWGFTLAETALKQIIFQFSI